MLNEEQQSLERRVEQLRLACQNVSKKVQNCLSTQGKQIDDEKRLVLFRFVSYFVYVHVFRSFFLWTMLSE